jgi:hypothetical protein
MRYAKKLKLIEADFLEPTLLGVLLEIAYRNSDKMALKGYSSHFRACFERMYGFG